MALDVTVKHVSITMSAPKTAEASMSRNDVILASTALLIKLNFIRYRPVVDLPQCSYKHFIGTDRAVR